VESRPSRTASSATASSATSTASRRELRSGRSSRARRRRGASAGWAVRVGVLAALGAATIVVPVVEELDGRAQAFDAAAPVADYPTAYEVLAGTVVDTTPTSLLAAAAQPVRLAESVSRALDRSPLPDCTGEAAAVSANGQIASSDLCRLWDANHMLRGDAAVALAELNLVFRATFNRDLCITDSYRTLAEQRRLAYTKGGLAAKPGQSNHGWGLAIDLCGSETRNSSVMSWLRDNGEIYGWHNPPWARRGGSGPYEPWHWEYLPGTVEMGTDWGS